MKPGPRRLIGVWILSLVLGGGVWVPAGLAQEKAEEKSSGDFIFSNQEIRFHLTALDGGTVSSQTCLGSVTAYYFWASWCRPCRAQVHILDRLYLKYRLLGVKAVGFCLDTEPQPLQDFLQAERLHMPCAQLSPDRLTAAAGRNIKGIPTLLLVSKQGRLVRKYEGLFSADELEKDIAGLLDQKNE